MKQVFVIMIGISISLWANFVRDNTTKIVTDQITTLQWQDDNNTMSTLSWIDAINYCETLTLGGYTSWRLPNINELYFLADRNRSNPAIDSIFQNTVSDIYWSSTTNFSNKSEAAHVNFLDGNNDWSPKTFQYKVRCVRDGQPIVFDHIADVKKNVPYTFTLVANDPDGDPLTYTYNTGTPSLLNGTLSGTAPNLTYTPQSGFTGIDRFTFTVNDGLFTSRKATVTLNVTNNAPVANNLTVNVEVNRSKQITLTASDPNGDNLTFRIIQNPTKGSYIGTPPDINYTAPKNAGTDSIVFAVSDGVLESNATVDINIVDCPIYRDQTNCSRYTDICIWLVQICVPVNGL